MNGTGVRTVGSIESGDPDTDFKFFYRLRGPGGKSESRSGYTFLYLAYVRSGDRINSPGAKFLATDWGLYSRLRHRVVVPARHAAYVAWRA
jgi:hypothetical protein